MNNIVKKVVLFCILIFIVLITGVSFSGHNYHVEMDGNRANIFDSTGKFMWYVDMPDKSNVFVSSEGIVLRFYDVYGNICEEIRDPELGYIIKSTTLPFTSNILKFYKLLSVLPFYILFLMVYFIVDNVSITKNSIIMSLLLFSISLIVRRFTCNVLPIDLTDILQIVFAGFAPVIIYCFILFVKKVNNFIAYSFASVFSVLMCIFSFIFGFFIV